MESHTTSMEAMGVWRDVGGHAHMTERVTVRHDKRQNGRKDHPGTAGGAAELLMDQVVELTRASNLEISSLNWLIRFLSERSVSSRTCSSSAGSCRFFS